MSNIWGNMDGFEEQYRYATTLYFLSMLAHGYDIIIDCIIREPGHGIDVFHGPNDTVKRLLSVIIKTDQLPGAAAYDSHMKMHT